MGSRYYAVCAASGGVWGCIAYVIGYQSMPRSIIWGGIAVSSFIGLAIGTLYRPAFRLPHMARAAMSLLALYVSAALFGLAVGLFTLLDGITISKPSNW